MSAHGNRPTDISPFTRSVVLNRTYEGPVLISWGMVGMAGDFMT